VREELGRERKKKLEKKGGGGLEKEENV